MATEHPVWVDGRTVTWMDGWMDGWFGEKGCGVSQSKGGNRGKENKCRENGEKGNTSGKSMLRWKGTEQNRNVLAACYLRYRALKIA